MKANVLYGARDIRIESYKQPELRPGMVVLRNRRVGICGSDLHYYEYGYCAAFVPDRPFILGHELTADVVAVANDVEMVEVGSRVTVNPARNCGFCHYCREGRTNLCRKTIMLGSASTRPPTDGALAEFVAVRADQCYVLPIEVDDSVGAMIEPFAVALHAVRRAGIVAGKRVLVIGAGTIGLLVAIAARAFGAVPIVVSDVVAARRAKALQLGANAIIDASLEDLTIRALELTGDGFDLIFEASGAPSALRAAFAAVRPGGTIVQIGTLGTQDVPLPANGLMNKEINLVGSMRYANEFDEAIRLAASQRVDLRPLINDVFTFDKSVSAFELAADKARSFKVQIQL
jgi:L-idonate 5-dehydrogenase